MKKTFTFLLIILCFAGCKTETEKLLDDACGKDISDVENKSACRAALLTNCGGVTGMVAVRACAQNPDQQKCLGVPAYCIKAYSREYLSK